MPRRLLLPGPHNRDVALRLDVTRKPGDQLRRPWNWACWDGRRFWEKGRRRRVDPITHFTRTKLTLPPGNRLFSSGKELTENAVGRGQRQRKQ